MYFFLSLSLYLLHAHTVSVSVYVHHLHVWWCRCLCRGSVSSVGVDEEAGEGAVFVCVAPVDLPSVQLHAHLVAHVQVQDHAVGGVVVVLISVLSNGAGSYLSPTEDRGHIQHW